MKSIATIPGSKTLALIERDEPQITAPDEVKIKMTRVGICGTDREIAHGGRADAEPGREELVIGHEMLGVVEEVGEKVSTVKPGDRGVFIVRRDCGLGLPCCADRSDQCFSGNYTERGIKARDGYMTEYVVDKEKYLVGVPDDLGDLAVLTEPLSVGEKAIDEALKIQVPRIPGAAYDTFLEGKKTLVAGLGPIGMLLAFALRLRGAEVWGLNRSGPDEPAAKLLTEIGGHHLNGSGLDVYGLDSTIGPFDLIFEATGSAQLEFDLLDALGINGVYVVTGIPPADREVKLRGGELMQQLVLNNQVLLGTVNASKAHNETALRDLQACRQRFGEAIDRVISHVVPYSDFQKAIFERAEGEIKTVLDFTMVSG
ncbi:MAG: glucose 1-dehydrogenase [Sphingobacteriaceae bacterium]|nr:glucose 1-dehydrogenase [Cytophagaceae bacterium]